MSSRPCEKINIVVSKDSVGLRIDKYITEYLTGISRSYVQKLLKNSEVTVNGKICKPNYKIVAYDIICIKISESTEPDIVAQNIPIDILYEDYDIIVINKPKDMVVHPGARHYNGTLVNALMYHCKGELSGINGVLRPGIVHRIDKDTTGVLMACKNDFSHKAIAKQLKEHSVTRKYVAIVHGVLKQDSGTIEGTIGRHPVLRKKMAVNVENGKHAVTHYRVLRRFSQYTFIECILETGRTHQIRVHMSHIRHPLLGDTLYGPEKCPFKLTGQTLHAQVLGIIHPRTEQYMEFEASLPEYFTHLLETIT